MTNGNTTPENDGVSWLMEFFKDAPLPTPEETLAHKAVALKISKTMLSDAECMRRVDAILRASSPDTCPKCNGSGNVGYRRAGGVCFRCDGVGFIRPK